MSVRIALVAGVPKDLNTAAGIAVGSPMYILNTGPYVVMTAEQTATPAAADMTVDSTTVAASPLNRFGQVGHDCVFVTGSLKAWGYSTYDTVLMAEAM
tara:strand:+ start:71 stop:364 length:294 start_codon:yes stop_codon:yes gene_type:complete